MSGTVKMKVAENDAVDEVSPAVENLSATKMTHPENKSNHSPVNKHSVLDILANRARDICDWESLPEKMKLL
jgi:hypothetical protein